MLTRRVALAGLAGWVVARAAQAQSLPSRPITIIVPYPPGGPIDVVARLQRRRCPPTSASPSWRALAVASPRRASQLPHVPTLAEAGIAGVEADAWSALFAPARTPVPIVERLHRAVVTALASDVARLALAAQGMTLVVRTPAEVAAWLPGEVAKWAAVIRAANVSVD